jgi:hypothetical protein
VGLRPAFPAGLLSSTNRPHGGRGQPQGRPGVVTTLTIVNFGRRVSASDSKQVVTPGGGKMFTRITLIFVASVAGLTWVAVAYGQHPRASSCAPRRASTYTIATKTGLISDAIGTHFVRKGVDLVYRARSGSSSMTSKQPIGEVFIDPGGGQFCISSQSTWFTTTLRNDYTSLACRACASTQTNAWGLYATPNDTSISVFRVTTVGETIKERVYAPDAPPLCRASSTWYYTGKGCWVWAGGTARGNSADSPIWKGC